MIRRSRHPWKPLAGPRSPIFPQAEGISGVLDHFRQAPQKASSIAKPAAKAAMPVAKAAAQSTPQGKAASVVLTAAMKDPHARAQIRRVVRDDPKANNAARALRDKPTVRRVSPPPRRGRADQLMVPAFAAQKPPLRSLLLRAFERGAG